MYEKAISIIALVVSILALVASFSVPIFRQSIDLATESSSQLPIAVSQWSRVEAVELEIARELSSANSYAVAQRWEESADVLERVAVLYERRADAATGVLSAVGPFYVLKEPGAEPLQLPLETSTPSATETTLSQGQEAYLARLRELNDVLLSESVVRAAFDSWSAAVCARLVAAVLKTDSSEQEKITVAADFFANPERICPV